MNTSSVKEATTARYTTPPDGISTASDIGKKTDFA